MYEDAFLNALIRGVDIDLLWGYEEGPGTIAWLHQLSLMAQRQGSKGKLRFNRDRSQAHAKLILWDHDGAFEACVGSHNWLSTRPPDSEAAWNDHRITNVSIVLRHPGLVSSLCRCAAAFWHTAQPALLTSTPNRWTRIGADIEERAAKVATIGGTAQMPGLLAGEEPNAKIGVILDAEHEYLLDQCFRQAERRILIASHRLGPPALRRLRLVAENPRAATMQFGVFYGEADVRGNAFDEISQLVVKSGGCLAEFSGLHAKVFVSDDLACITSFNPLYGAPFTASASAREVGIVVEGAEPASWLWKQFRSEPKVDGEA
jgi:hypothetical protein